MPTHRRGGGTLRRGRARRLLGPMFNDVARVDWSEHLPKLTAFAASLVADPPVANLCHTKS
jgi:hypothetical protein